MVATNIEGYTFCFAGDILTVFMRTYILSAFVICLALLVSAAEAQQVTKESVPGIRNLARLETTVACAGAITPRPFAWRRRPGAGVCRAA